MIVTSQELIEGPKQSLKHIVLLGAGASRAACPTGDKRGNILPVMTDLIEVCGLGPLLAGVDSELTGETNFEALYSQLAVLPVYADLISAVEQRVADYFSSLELPDTPTLYDYLLLGLRSKDAIFTFNWDPFLFDAYERNSGVATLPEVFFLHGNVRIGACPDHEEFGDRKVSCPTCGRQFIATPLLYPVGNKDYSSDPYIARSWRAAEVLFEEAFTMTIFGYGAPNSDKDAVELLRNSWLRASTRELEHIEIIDIADPSAVTRSWEQFAPTYHLDIHRRLENSRLFKWPRRSCEALIIPMSRGEPCEDFPMQQSDTLEQLQTSIRGIAEYESSPKGAE